MTKAVTTDELADIVTSMLVDADPPGVDTYATFQQFMTDLAKLVCKYCGGVVLAPASPQDGLWRVVIHDDGSLPPGGGVWAKCDNEARV